ncbi:MAG: prolipoprotein diacylglyceryl transferase family protein, partial [Bacillota bacterium]
MLIEDINPILFQVGPLTVRWYGLMFAVSAAVGLYYLHKHGLKKGYAEDSLLVLVLIAILGLIIGARGVYVLTNWPT